MTATADDQGSSLPAAVVFAVGSGRVEHLRHRCLYELVHYKWSGHEAEGGYNFITLSICTFGRS